MPPPSYHWSVSVGGGSPFAVDAAYPVLDDGGHMLLKDPDHKIVFAAQPGTGCTFTRGGLATPGASPALGLLPAAAFPDGCKCSYTTMANFGPATPGVRWTRNVNWGCKADHTEIDKHAVVTAQAHVADGPVDCYGAALTPGHCPHRIPPTVRCHECSPVLVPGDGQAHD